MTEQVEKAYQRQKGVPVYVKGKGKGSKKEGARYWKNVGLGFKTPKSAIDGTYVDIHCPFTSDISIRGRIIKGVVKTAKMKRTIIVRREYLHYISKYNRYEKRHRNIPAHLSPCFRVKEGDNVVIGQCRAVAKTVRFNVLKVDASSTVVAQVKSFKKF